MHFQHTKGVSGLQSPQSPESAERPVWSLVLPTLPSELENNVVHELPVTPPAEMEGSTYIDEHRPHVHSDEKVGEAEDREEQAAEDNRAEE